jgi:tetratricopeptide (TPR) repeat protein
MGLHDEAIKEFQKALQSTREVQSRVMIAMCLRDSGNATEAVQQLKAALHAGPSERECQSIYYEIANTYESIGDEPEALYYFETVLKRDPNFADAHPRAEQLRARVGRGRRPVDDDI